MFQKLLLKTFVKSFTTSDYNKLRKLCSQDTKIDEDANGADFLERIITLAKLEILILDGKNKIYEMAYKLYGLSNDEIKIVES